MPELPEVETVMRGLSPFMEGAKIEDVKLRRKDLRIPFPKNMSKTLKGKKVHSLSRRAKYILVHLDDDLCLAIHLGMSGSVAIINDNEEYELQKHDHVIFSLKTKKKKNVRIIYNDPRRFGMMFLFNEDEMHTHKAFAHLGPEPLGNEFSSDILAERLKGKNTSIKQALLDQRVVVGVGNIYACEALYDSGISPFKKASSLKGKKIELLAASIQKILRRAIEAGGSTLKDYRHADGSLGYFQHSFIVYDREGEVCVNSACAKAAKPCIKREVQSGRSTFYCSRTQK